MRKWSPSPLATPASSRWRERGRAGRAVRGAPVAGTTSGSSVGGGAEHRQRGASPMIARRPPDAAPARPRSVGGGLGVTLREIPDGVRARRAADDRRHGRTPPSIAPSAGPTEPLPDASASPPASPPAPRRRLHAGVPTSGCSAAWPAGWPSTWGRSRRAVRARLRRRRVLRRPRCDRVPPRLGGAPVGAGDDGRRERGTDRRQLFGYALVALGLWRWAGGSASASSVTASVLAARAHRAGRGRAAASRARTSGDRPQPPPAPPSPPSPPYPPTEHRQVAAPSPTTRQLPGRVDDASGRAGDDASGGAPPVAARRDHLEFAARPGRKRVAASRRRVRPTSTSASFALRAGAGRARARASARGGRGARLIALGIPLVLVVVAFEGSSTCRSTAGSATQRTDHTRSRASRRGYTLGIGDLSIDFRDVDFSATRPSRARAARHRAAQRDRARRRPRGGRRPRGRRQRHHVRPRRRSAVRPTSTSCVPGRPVAARCSSTPRSAPGTSASNGGEPPCNVMTSTRSPWCSAPTSAAARPGLRDRTVDVDRDRARLARRRVPGRSRCGGRHQHHDPGPRPEPGVGSPRRSAWRTHPNEPAGAAAWRACCNPVSPPPSSTASSTTRAAPLSASPISVASGCCSGGTPWPTPLAERSRARACVTRSRSSRALDCEILGISFDAPEAEPHVPREVRLPVRLLSDFGEQVGVTYEDARPRHRQGGASPKRLQLPDRSRTGRLEKSLRGRPT